MRVPTPGELRRLLEEAGFEVAAWSDTTDAARAWFVAVAEKIGNEGLPPLGFHLLLGSDFQVMAQNALGKAVNPKADSEMLDILEHNGNDMMLQRFAGGARAAHKDGETDQVRTECSLWYLRNRIVACVLTKENADQRWIIDNEGNVTLARMGEAIVKAWGGVPPPR